MCPSIDCPNCGNHAYHRGSCESCDYDPMTASIRDPLDPMTQGQFLDTFDVSYMTAMRPFPLVRFSSDSDVKIATLAAWLEYKGPMFNHEPFDMLDTTGQFGFDLVKDKAKKFLEGFLVPSYV